MTRIVTLLLLSVVLAPLGACAKKREPLAAHAQVAPGGYAVAFSVARDEVRRFGFTLDRVDARAGVITTTPQTSAGLATPWERQETTMRQERENLLHRQRRTVTVAFAAAVPNGQSAPDDLREWDGDIRVDVIVGVERVYRFGIRPQPVSIRLSSVATDPELRAAGAQPGLAVASDRDEWLAGRIASRIEATLTSEGVAAASSP